jgi:signal transduction histidine kinase
VAISMLPAVWAGKTPADIADSAAEVILRTLRLDVVYLQLQAPSSSVVLEAASASAVFGDRLDVPGLRRWLAPMLQADPAAAVSSLPSLTGSGTIQLAALPIGYERDAGVVVAGSRQPDFPTASDHTLLTVAANQVALVLSQKWAEEQLREEARTVETINRVGQSLTSELRLEQVVQAVTDAATELTGAQFGAFFYNVVGEQGESYTLYTLSGAPREAFESFPMPRNTALFEPTFRGEGVVRIDDVTQDSRYGQNPPYYGMPPGHLPVRSYLAAPVVSRSGEVLGGLFFGHAEPGVFSERAERILVGIAGQAAIAIDNARLYQQAQRAVSLRDEFLAAASHDLKNPLAAIKGIAQLLRRRARRMSAPEAQGFADGLQRIDSTITRMTHLIDTLLDITRVQMGQPLPLDRRPLDLVALARQAAEEQQQATQRHDIRVDTAVPELVGVWDAARLERLLANLLGNAVKYSPDGGEITLSVRAEAQAGEPWAVLVVQDRGLGIPAADLPRIFERFRRGGNVEGQIGGTGIGLVAVRQVVEQHGGEISVDSQEGSGTTFTVRLPLALDLTGSVEPGP